MSWYVCSVVCCFVCIMTLQCSCLAGLEIWTSSTTLCDGVIVCFELVFYWWCVAAAALAAAPAAVAAAAATEKSHCSVMLHTDVRHVFQRRRDAAVAAAVPLPAVVAASRCCDCCCCANVDARWHYCCVSSALYQRHKETSTLLLLSPLRDMSVAASI